MHCTPFADTTTNTSYGVQAGVCVWNMNRTAKHYRVTSTCLNQYRPTRKPFALIWKTEKPKIQTRHHLVSLVWPGDLINKCHPQSTWSSFWITTISNRLQSYPSRSTQPKMNHISPPKFITKKKPLTCTWSLSTGRAEARQGQWALPLCWLLGTSLPISIYSNVPHLCVPQAIQRSLCYCSCLCFASSSLSLLSLLLSILLVCRVIFVRGLSRVLPRGKLECWG